MTVIYLFIYLFIQVWTESLFLPSFLSFFHLLIYFIEVHRHDDGTAALSFKLFKVLCYFKLFGPFYYKAAVFAHPTDATGTKGGLGGEIASSSRPRR